MVRARFAPIALVLTLSAPAFAQFDANFDPSGRHRVVAGGGHREGGNFDRRQAHKPSTAELIDRYSKALLANPASAFPLQKLAELYRGRDGTLDKLVADFEQRAASETGDAKVKAKLALAAVYLAARKKDAAVRLLDQLAAAEPGLAAPHLMRAQLAEQAGDKEIARREDEAALPLVKESTDKERVLRALMTLALDAKDYDLAKQRHRELVKVAGGSWFVKKELGAELMNRGEYARAEAEFRELVKAAAGDNRALAPALKDLGDALARQKKLDEALKVLDQARAAAGPQGGLRNEILALLVDVYREQNKLPELIAILEREGGREKSRVVTIGELYEETGQVDKAMKSYREALRIDAGDVDVRVRLVHLLQTAGELDEAIKEYQALIKAAPERAEYVFELSDTLIARGERKKALELLADLERHAQGNGDALAALADYYERIEEPALAVKVFERLASLPEGDPQYLIDLGDRYYQRGDKPKALATWKRILSLVKNRADALATLGDVYLDHDMPDEALDALREAVKLSPDKRYKKQLAIALEKTASAMSVSQFRYREALDIWTGLLGDAKDDALLARDCRNHIVGMWAILRELESHVAPLSQQLAATPPDLESGRLLAEVLRRLNRLPEAETALRKVVKAAPGDEQARLALERVLVLQRNLAGAIEVLKGLVELDPKKAREYYQRMAQYAAELYRDDDAIDYASRALELSPDDAEGHYRLAQMYRRRQQVDKAMGELRKAIAKNQRLYKAYFDLAELLLSAGQVDQADRLYRQLVRLARDDEFVIRAARLAMQIDLGRGTLPELEHELLPLALGNPNKSVYRRLLVELYGNMALPLVQIARLGSPAEADKARQELAAIGARAVKPLLDALSDPGANQQKTAIEVLAYVQNKGAGPALFNFARGGADVDLRVRAMVACGALSDPSLLPEYEELLAPSNGGAGAGASDAVAVAAAWGVARMGDRAAEPLLAKLAQFAAPDVRALAAIGLGLTHNVKYAAPLAKLARSADAGPMARAAAAVALGELGERTERPLLLALAESSELPVQLAALTALARLETGSGRAVQAGPGQRHAATGGDLAASLARALLSERPDVRKTAIAAATALATGEYRRAAGLTVPDGAVSLSETLASMAPHGYSRAEQARALAELAGPLASAAAAVVATSSERAAVVADAILGQLSPLMDAPVGRIDAPAEKLLATAADAMARATVRGFIALAGHPAEEIRKRAIEVLSHRSEPDARRAVVAALDERDPEVCRAALSALDEPDGEALVAIISLLHGAESWSVRENAAEALGRAPDHGAEHAAGQASAGVDARVDDALARAATSDPFAIVREASLVALGRRNPTVARALAASIAQSDDEPHLRKVASELARAAGR